MLDVCEIWPGITPWNIWDLRYGDWLGIAATVDARRAAKQEGSR